MIHACASLCMSVPPVPLPVSARADSQVGMLKAWHVPNPLHASVSPSWLENLRTPHGFTFM